MRYASVPMVFGLNLTLPIFVLFFLLFSGLAYILRLRVSVRLGIGIG